MLARVFKMNIEELPEPVPRAIFDFVKGKAVARSEDVGPAVPEPQVATAVLRNGEGASQGDVETKILSSLTVEEKAAVPAVPVTKAATRQFSDIPDMRDNKASSVTQEPVSQQRAAPVVTQSAVTTSVRITSKGFVTGMPTAPELTRTLNSVVAPATSTSSLKREAASEAKSRSLQFAWEEESYARWTALL